MNLLWIDNVTDWLNELADQLEKAGWNVKTLSEDELQKKPDDIGVTIFREYAAVDLFLININLLLPGQRRIDNAGIQLLKLIRLHNLRQHCVVYSFLSREQLMTLSPENLILFSSGISYHRLPDDLLRLPLKLLTKKTSPESIARYLMAELNLPDERHMLANWWGVLQLWKVHCAVKNQESAFEIEFADKHLKHSLAELNSFQGLMARYLFREKEEDVELHLKELVQKQEDTVGARNIEIDDVFRLMNEQTEQFIKLKEQKKILEDAFLDEYGNRAALTVLQELGVLPQSIEQILFDLENRQEVAAGVIQKLDESNELEYLIIRERNQLEQDLILREEQIQELVLQLEKKQGFVTTNFRLDESRNRLKKLNPGILYVDDQAEEGWAYVLQQIIYDGESERFVPIVPLQNDSTEKIVAEIIKKYNEKDTSLIILDLRLKGETGHLSNVDTISGFKVLKLLRMQYINCPILIFSASNKMWSLTEAIKYGASAYWMKEGIEDNKDISNSIGNYLQLVDLIAALCLSTQYEFLKDFKLKYNAIRNADTQYWWEGLTWINSNAKYQKTKITVSKKLVLKIIGEAVFMLENMLHHKLLKNTSIEFEKYIPSLIIAQLARIIELIHKTDSEKEEGDQLIKLSVRVFDQLPQLKNRKFVLISIRNQAVHYMNKSFEELRVYVNQLFEYLNDCHFLDKKLPELSEKQGEVNMIAEPLEGAQYTSVICKRFDTDHTFFYLTNPGLALERANIILDMRWNPQLNDISLQEGDRIEFILKISRKPTSVNYFASEAKKID